MPAGQFVADHEVRLDARCWQYEAFADLLGTWWHAAPDRRAEDEARIVAEVGRVDRDGGVRAGRRGAGRERPGHGAGGGAGGGGGGTSLLFRPLELAHVGGKPLAVQDVTLVMESAGTMGRGARRSGSGCGCWGCSACPKAVRPLNLRRERHALVRLIEGIAAAGRRPTCGCCSTG